MLVRLLDVQAEGAVVCRSSQVGTIGGAATEAHTFHQKMLFIQSSWRRILNKTSEI